MIQLQLPNVWYHLPIIRQHVGLGFTLCIQFNETCLNVLLCCVFYGCGLVISAATQQCQVDLGSNRNNWSHKSHRTATRSRLQSFYPALLGWFWFTRYRKEISIKRRYNLCKWDWGCSVNDNESWLVSRRSFYTCLSLLWNITCSAAPQLCSMLPWRSFPALKHRSSWSYAGNQESYCVVQGGQTNTWYKRRPDSIWS